MRVCSQVGRVYEHQLTFFIDLEEQICMYQLDVVISQLISYEITRYVDITQYHG